MARSAAHRDQGETRTLLVVLVAFAIIAALVYVNQEDPESRRIRHVAEAYARAWQTGRLATLEYDQQSSDEVRSGGSRRVDPHLLARRVAFVTRRLGETRPGTTGPTPQRVEVTQVAPNGASGGRATASLRVTWRLVLAAGSRPRDYRWTYSVTLTERRYAGTWRVLWTPQAVHPLLRPGQVLGLERVLSPQLRVVGAGDTVLRPAPPGGQPVARGVLDALTTQISTGRAGDADAGTGGGGTSGTGTSRTGTSGTATSGAEPGGAGTPPASGLQDLYDDRLADYAGIAVRVYPADRVTDPGEGAVPRLRPAVRTVFSGPPAASGPLRVTLDRRTQQAAQAALRGIPGTATLVVVRPRTGDLLAVANSADNAATALTGPAVVTDPGLLARRSPGPVFGLVTSLALLRGGLTTASLVDCTTPYATGGRVFTNAQGPGVKDVTLAAAVDGGCVTALARTATTVRAADLGRAAYDLGVAAPRDDAGEVPGWERIADQLGTAAFHGLVPAGAAGPAHAETLTGEGGVLAGPVSMARMAATVASGTRRAVRLVVDPPATRPDVTASLSSSEAGALQEIMSKGVTEPAGSAHALAPLGDVHALAGTASSGAAGRTHAWCVGYAGGYAFAVLVPDVPGVPALARNQALGAAAAFLAAVR